MPIPTQKRRRTMRPYRRVKRRMATRTNRAKASKVNVKNQLYFFTRRWASPTIVGAPTSNPLLVGSVFRLNDLPNVSDFTNLFDRYMITYVKINFYLKIDPSAQIAASATFPKIYMVRDYDDEAIIPGNINTLREAAKCVVRVLNPNRPVTIGLRPATQSLTQLTATTTVRTPQWKQWIDLASPDVPYYALKWAIDDFTNTNYKLDVEYQYWFRCKDVR